MSDVFVSYKSEDRVRVAPLVAALEADGIGVWWDAHIGGGTEWRDSIEAELTAARCVVVVWSERSTGREGSFVRDEATRSLRRGAYLPVRIDPVEPPLGFGETQAISLIGWKGDRRDPNYQALLAAARAVIAGTPRPVPPAYRAPKRVVDRRLVLGGGAAAVAVAGTGGWWALHRDSAPGDSVAVLPFENLSGDPAQAYFSDGIADELRSALARIAQLKVAAGTSSDLMRNVDVPTAAIKLGVANVVIGTVRRGADTIRINASLIDGRSGLAHWSQTYDRAIGDALAIQTSIAENVAGALRIALGHAEKALLTLGGTNDPVAQDAYLRARDLIRRRKGADAIQHLDAAIAADPNFAVALVSKASATQIMAGSTLGGAALRAKLAEAEAVARRAITIAPGLGAAWGALSAILLDRLDLRGAQRAIDAAVKASPGDSRVLRLQANLEARFGNEDAIALWHRAWSLDPLRATNAIEFANTLLFLGRVDQAIDMAQTGVARLPDDADGRGLLAQAKVLKGRTDDAIKTVSVLPPDDINRLVAEALALAATDRSASDRALARLIEKYGDLVQYQVAQIHAWRRETDPAFAAISRAWDLTDPGLNGLKTDLLLVPIRSDPRFGQWLRTIGFA